jgi:phage terminase large subunit-like protein
VACKLFYYSAAEPESLRGPQHHIAWADEIAKWPMGPEAWDNLMMGMRLGQQPRTVATTTPRPVPLIRALTGVDGKRPRGVVITRGRTADNRASLPGSFIAAMEESYGGTRLGLQELDGEMIEDVAGALWTRALIERCRVAVVPMLRRIVVAVDPPASAHGDACGIVVAGIGTDDRAYVIEDATVGGVAPERWARAAASAAARHGADRVIAEANNGGAMVESVLRVADAGLPVRLVHASRGKVARAEPISALYEAGRVAHAGAFPDLEDELAGLQAGGGYAGPTRSPDRADALVWALTELMLGDARRPGCGRCRPSFFDRLFRLGTGVLGNERRPDDCVTIFRENGMNWFDGTAARAAARPALVRSMAAMPIGEWPRSYEAQVRDAYVANPVAQRAVRLVAEGVAGVPVYAGAGHDAAVRLIAGGALIETVAAQMLLHGNAYVQIIDGGEDVPIELVALRPERVAVEPDADGWPSGYLYRAGERTTRFPLTDGLGRPAIVHLKALHPIDDHYGLGCLGAAAGAVATGAARAPQSMSLP